MSGSAGQRTFIIAEVAQAHDGSLGILHSYIDAVAATGVDAIKFQTHVADAESSAHEPFRVAFSRKDATRQEYWRRMQFSVDEWKDIKGHCEAAGLEFMSTPACVTALEWLEEVGVRRYKIGSGDTGNHLLLQRAAATGKQILLSTGLSDLDEIDAAVARITAVNDDLVLMQCTSEYPVPAERLGLGYVTLFRTRYNRPVGFSDHSGTIYPSLAAVALGASVVEVHVVFDKRMFGPDSPASLTIDELTRMIEGIRMIEASLGAPLVRDSAARSDMRMMFGKSLSVRRDMAAGDVVKLEDLESKKPAGMGIPARNCDAVVGRPLRRPLARWDFIREDDLG